jgi:hypothetical protein
MQIEAAPQTGDTTRRRFGRDVREAGMAIDIAAAATSPGLAEGPPLRARGWLKGLDSAIGWLVEIPAALLVLAEIGVLLSGVVSRYVFHEPLIWTDELAGILFLWLAMLGAVVAFRRAEHMRMTALVAMSGARTRAFLETLARWWRGSSSSASSSTRPTSSPARNPSSRRPRWNSTTPGAPPPSPSASP